MFRLSSASIKQASYSGIRSQGLNQLTYTGNAQSLDSDCQAGHINDKDLGVEYSPKDMVSVNLVNNQIVYVHSKFFFCLNFKCDRKDNAGKKTKAV